MIHQTVYDVNVTEVNLAVVAMLFIFTITVFKQELLIRKTYVLTVDQEKNSNAI